MSAPNEQGTLHAGPSIELETRARFEAGLAAAAERVAQGVPHALLVVAIERVADVARECGPEAEAALLAVVRSRLHDQLGAEALGSRLATDRFALLRPRCLPRDALALGRRVRGALEGGQFVWRGLSFRLGATVGVLELGDTTIEPGDQIANATRACQAAAALGGDGVVMSTGRPELDAKLAEEQAWRQHLREVI